MKTFRSSGRFGEQPYYTLSEIEQICVEELEKHGLYPSEPSPIRIDRFVEKRFGIQPSYENLPQGVLGFTRFSSNGVEEIVVSRTLDEEGSKIAERRLRTTLAHEAAGHGLLHAHLFALATELKPLFGDGLDPKAPKILCREDVVTGIRKSHSNKYDGRWWEFQANQAMGAALLPRKLVEVALNPVVVVSCLGKRILPPDQHETAARLLADIFDVNPAAARIRLDALYPQARSGQLTL